ncbi:hypothetical protein B0F90DRAFT_1742144 [Multifurca ochricompacta]|uniref:Uncharacterized protein n=1 Tax=Multifurca ochricompacta TaxID=376703 RepID=A0AAD4QLL4_9AGAM|nr:hypothetical protein B0F90DRAFT_1742144 [Multifurca ochricompacta]
MTIPPDSLSRHPLHSSSSPVMCKSNLPVSKLLQTPHISFVEGHTQEVSSTCSVLHLNTAFLTSRSRVLKFFNLPPFPSVFLHDLFLNTAHESKSLVPIPKSLWIRRAECSAISPRDSVWAVFGTHEEARSAFTLFGSSTSISPALESDLEPLHSLQRLQQHRTITGLPMSITIQSPVPASASDLPCNGRGRLAPLRPSHAMFCRPDHTNTTTSFPVPGFTLSSNPPNPRTLFRMGDWMCPSANCAAHNFG